MIIQIKSEGRVAGSSRAGTIINNSIIRGVELLDWVKWVLVFWSVVNDMRILGRSPFLDNIANKVGAATLGDINFGGGGPFLVGDAVIENIIISGASF